MTHRPGFQIGCTKSTKENGDPLVTLDSDERYRRMLTKLKDGRYTVTFDREVHSRSAAQNRAYWGLIVEPCSESSGYEKDEVHEILKRFCNPKIVAVLNTETGEMEEVTIGGSTVSLNVEEMSAYYKRCQQFAAEKWDSYCPDPNEEGQFSEQRSA